MSIVKTINYDFSEFQYLFLLCYSLGFLCDFDTRIKVCVKKT